MAAKRTRVLFFAPGHPEAVNNVWLDLDPVAGTAALLRDYGADLAPQPGWEIEVGHVGRFEVRTVERRPTGAVMTLVRIGGA